MACASILFNERDDNYVGILECAALVLALCTFHDHVKSAIVTTYTNKKGVPGAVVAGGSSYPEQKKHDCSNVLACGRGEHCK